MREGPEARGEQLRGVAVCRSARCLARITIGKGRIDVRVGTKVEEELSKGTLGQYEARTPPRAETYLQEGEADDEGNFAEIVELASQYGHYTCVG